MTTIDVPPSVFLPVLQPTPSPTALLSALKRIAEIFTPAHVTIDLTAPTQHPPEDEEDEFEASHTRGWLQRVVTIGSKKLSTDGNEDWENVVEKAASILADMSGHCGVCYTYMTTKLFSDFGCSHSRWRHD